MKTMRVGERIRMRLYRNSLLAAILTIALMITVACGPSTVDVREGDKKVIAPQLTEEEIRIKKQRDEEEKRRKELAASLKVRKVVVAETPEFVPGVEIPAQKSFAGGVVSVYQVPPNYNHAADRFKEAVNKDKNFLEAYFNLGMVYERTGQPQEALEVYQEALDNNPESGSARAYIGKVYLAKAREAYEKGETQAGKDLERKAKDLFDQVIVKNPDNVQANNALALYWLMKAQMVDDRPKQLDYVATAEDFVQNVLTVQPANLVALNTRGLIYLLKGELQIARWIFENKVLTLDKFSTEALNNLGLTYYKLGDTPRAVVQFSKAINANPENLEARLNLASILLNYLNYGAALEQYKFILTVQEDNVEATVGMGSSLVGMQEFEDGFGLYRRAFDLDKRRIDLLMRIARIYQIKLVDFDNAIKSFEDYLVKAQSLGVDLTEGKAGLEQSKKMAEQMKKMEEEMRKADEEAKRMEKIMKKKAKELEKRMKIVESKANGFRKKLEKYAKDNAKATDKAIKKHARSARKLIPEFAGVEAPFKEAREYIGMTMVEEAVPMVEGAEKKLAELEPQAIEALGIKKVQKLEEEGGMEKKDESGQKADEKKEEKKPADKKAEKKPAEKKRAEKKPAEKKPAEKKPADKKPADKKPADKKPADKKPAEKKAE